MNQMKLEASSRSWFSSLSSSGVLRVPSVPFRAFHLLKLPRKKVFALSASNSTHSADEDTNAESQQLD